MATDTNQDKAARIATLVLAAIGSLLAVAESIKDIPALAPYSNWATAFIGLAVSVKQVILMIHPPAPKP